MRLVLTTVFRRGFENAPFEIKRKTEKAVNLLLQDLRHPSLRAKKIYHQKLRQWVWQGRVDDSWRFYFDITDSAIYLLAIGPHPK